MRLLTDAPLYWKRLPVRDRLRVLSKARNCIALDPEQFFRAAGEDTRKTSVDMLTSEVLPLLAAIRFLEESAEGILKTRKLGRKGLPLWLTGIHSEVQRVPFGKVLVIGPSNYPLLLPGLQTVQALAAGNCVVWKPGLGGRKIAEALASVLVSAGLPEGLLRVTDESVAAAEHEIAIGVDKVFFTGSVPSGQALLRQLAERLIPCVVELSGCDALIILPGADIERAVLALTFGTRLNGSATCMAPRRILLVGATQQQKSQFRERLRAALQTVPPVRLPFKTSERLAVLLQEAEASGASVYGEATTESVQPILVLDGAPTMAIAQEDIFAPVLSLIEVTDVAAAIDAQAACPFGLTASIFGDDSECRALAEHLEVGTVFINDVIVPSADPRLPFGGRRFSGFGVTQGVEGLLEMTAIKTVSVRRTSNTKHLEPITTGHAGFFASFIRATYADRWTDRIRGIKETIRTGRKLM